MVTPPLSGVEATSLLVAGARAEESRRPDRLFEDRLAQTALDAADWWSQPRDPAGAAFVATRTRRIDEFVLAAMRNGIRQVVSLGSGLDARPFRLSFPNPTVWYEVDRSPVHQFKNAIAADARLPERCARRTVVADLSGDWTSALEASGVNRHLRTLWILEGVLVYLTEGQVDALMREIARRTRLNSAFVATAGRPTDSGGTGLGWRLPTEGRDWMRRYGWAGHIDTVPKLLRAYGRAPVPGAAIADLLFGYPPRT